MNRSILEFDDYQVYGIKEYGQTASVTTDGEADYFSLYGLVKGDTGSDFFLAIGDYDSRMDAEIVQDVLNNKKRSLPPQ